MSKYNAEKRLKLTQARGLHICAKCGKTIEKGQMYYRENLGLIPKPPGMILRGFCKACVERTT